MPCSTILVEENVSLDLVIGCELINPSKCTYKEITQNITVPKFRVVRYTYDAYCILVTYAYHDVGFVPYPPRNKHALHTTCIHAFHKISGLFKEKISQIDLFCIFKGKIFTSHHGLFTAPI